MKTQAEILEAVKSKQRKPETFDGRDFSRLSEFFPVSEWEHFGFKLNEGATPPEPKAWTRENIIEQLRGDVAFGFQKALDRRGLSAGFMFSTVRMWMWVLNDDLQHFDEDNNYRWYGLPLFKAVAVKYGFDNPIGNHDGTEDEYADWA